MRVLAGPRGFSGLQWSGAGFRYALTIERGDPIPFDADIDPTALNRDVALARLDEVFGP
jgi:hypothetical protein